MQSLLLDQLSNILNPTWLYLYKPVVSLVGSPLSWDASQCIMSLATISPVPVFFLVGGITGMSFHYLFIGAYIEIWKNRGFRDGRRGQAKH